MNIAEMLSSTANILPTASRAVGFGFKISPDLANYFGSIDFLVERRHFYLFTIRIRLLFLFRDFVKKRLLLVKKSRVL